MGQTKGRRSTREAARAGSATGLLLLCALVAPSAHGQGIFTPGSAKREGKVLFAGAPIIQGNMGSGSTSDLLSFPDGVAIGTNFDANFDANQGWISFWITPEWSGPDGLNRVILRWTSGGQLGKRNNDVLRLTVGTGVLDSPSVAGWTAGTTYRVDARWDSRNPLVGINHMCISIDDVHTCGQPAPFTPDPSSASINIGSRSDKTQKINAIIEGLAIRRRPGFDGTAGIDVGNGDELALAYNGGLGQDDAWIAGSWDTVFFLPTNSQVGALTTGTGEAWSHPHTANWLVGGLMLAGDRVADGWIDELSPAGVGNLPSNQKIFDGGYQFTTNAVDEGIYQQIAVAPGQDFVIRALAHSDGSCQPKVIFWDQTGGAEIGSLAGSTGSTRTAPDQLIFTGEAPPGSNAIRVKLVNGVASGTCYWHQAEVLTNLLSNPSLESGGGTPYIPTDWTNQELVGGDTWRETTTKHSGSASFGVLAAAKASGFNMIRQAMSNPIEDDFYSYGGFLYHVDQGFPRLAVTNGRLVRHNSLDSKIHHSAVTTGNWEHVPGVGRRDDDSFNSQNDNLVYGGQFNVANEFFADDAYVFHLDNVVLTATPADVDDSHEGTDEIRVDGRDTFVQTGVGALGTALGVIGFDWRPRHSAANGSAFDESTDEAFIVSLYGDPDNWIEVLWESANTVRLRYRAKAISNTGATWDAAGAIAAGTRHPVEVAYAGGFITLKVDGITRINTPLITGDFDVAPDDVYFGSDPAGSHQGDATFANLTTEVELLSFEALPLNSAVNLSWRTASELDNLGFHLHRSLSKLGPWTRITPSLIPGLGSSPEGASYSFRDTGLVNGVEYFYFLEDIDSSSVSTFHGPISAVPGAGAPPEEEEPGEGEPPAEPPSAEPQAYGTPEGASLRIVSRTRDAVVLELSTPGFYATETEAGHHFSIPGFDDPSLPTAAAIPFKRAVVGAWVGKTARIAWVRHQKTRTYPGLAPAAVGEGEMIVGWDGTVRPGRRPQRLKKSNEGLLPELPARIAGDAFVGEKKKLALELSPLRFDTLTGEMRLTRKLRVKIVFDRPSTSKETGSGSTGRLEPDSVSKKAPRVLAYLHTQQTGLHAVSFKTLFPRGRKPIPLKKLRLSLQGHPVAFHVQPQRKDFRKGSVLYFYASTEASSTEYSPETTYALEESRGGVRMRTVSAAPKGKKRKGVTLSPLLQADYETNRYYQAGLLQAPDIWLWDFMTGGTTKPFPFTVEGLDLTSSQTAHLHVVFQGASDAADVEEEHHLSVSVNGTPVGETTFGGKLAHVFTTGLSASLLHEGENELTLTNLGDTGAYSFVFLDRVHVVFPETTGLRAGRFDGFFPEGGVATVVGNARYGVDVTSPTSPRWLTKLKRKGGKVRLQAQAQHRYLLASKTGLLAPRVSKPLASTLRQTTQQADYVLIAPEAYLEAAQPLLERRRDQGLTALGVSFEEITSEFGHGSPSAEAIRDFLAYAYHEWTGPSLRYALLLGDSSYDPRNFTGLDQGAPLPALWAKTSYLWTSSDPTLGAINGEDLLPDVAIGRLPAKTLEEAQALIQKVLEWEGQDLGGKAVLVADNPDLAGDFEADVLDIEASYLTDRETQRLFLRELGAGTRPQILSAFDAGASLMSYVGHGGAAVWASENVLNSWDPPKLLAQSRQPLMLTFNCLNGYFVAPNYDSLSEAFLKVEGRGTVGAFTPSGLSLDGPAHRFHRALMAEITGGTHERLGDAVLAAQAAYAETGVMPELLAIYHLLGDPGMMVR